MTTTNLTSKKKLAVIYANESNIWDNDTHRFHFGKNFDEMSYAMPLSKAEDLLKEINSQRRNEEAYLIEITILEEEEK